MDVSHCDAATLQARLPATYERFQSLVTDIATDPMEVAPTVHYSMGGICADPDTGATEVSGLYAIGEAAAGLHGANRLGATRSPKRWLRASGSGRIWPRCWRRTPAKLLCRPICHRASSRNDKRSKP